tara:strand:+ start:59 stop:493 length:435 start_codon:yes stop_codon:yes gene_type:complete
VKKLLCVLLILPLTSCLEIDVDKEESPDRDFKNIFITLGEISYVSDDKTYANYVFDVEEINDDIMEDGTVIAYLERPASEDTPQRWSQFPQYCLNCENAYGTIPSFVYFSYGEGSIRVSLRSKSDITDATRWLKGKKVKLTIIE